LISVEDKDFLLRGCDIDRSVTLFHRQVFLLHHIRINPSPVPTEISVGEVITERLKSLITVRCPVAVDVDPVVGAVGALLRHWVHPQEEVQIRFLDA
jgi:hypothetical protein